MPAVGGNAGRLPGAGHEGDQGTQEGIDQAQGQDHVLLDDRGSTFTCAVDEKAVQVCTSPFTKKYKFGKHRVVITAVSPFGIADPAPVTVKFKVTRPKA